MQVVLADALALATPLHYLIWALERRHRGKSTLMHILVCSLNSNIVFSCLHACVRPQDEDDCACIIVASLPPDQVSLSDR
jgi:hypothetical protein